MQKQDCEQLTLFQVGFPVSRFPPQGSAGEETTTVSSGRKLCALCQSCAPLGLLAKTLLLVDIIQDLERIGYAVQTFVIPACGVGHTRGGDPGDCAVREDGRKQGSRWRAVKNKNAREWEER